MILLQFNLKKAKNINGNFITSLKFYFYKVQNCRELSIFKIVCGKNAKHSTNRHEFWQSPKEYDRKCKRPGAVFEFLPWILRRIEKVYCCLTK